MMPSSIRALVLSALVILLLPGAFCSQDGAIRVELDVFSGVENPCWNLTADESDEFLGSFQALNRTEAEFVDAGLGYRGFLVEGLKSYDRISVYGGVVHASSGNSSSRFEDKGRSLEMRLLSTGKEHLDSGLYSQILSEIQAKKR